MIIDIMMESECDKDNLNHDGLDVMMLTDIMMLSRCNDNDTMVVNGDDDDS